MSVPFAHHPDWYWQAYVAAQLRANNFVKDFKRLIFIALRNGRHPDIELNAVLLSLAALASPAPNFVAIRQHRFRPRRTVPTLSIIERRKSRKLTALRLCAPAAAIIRT